MGVREHQHVPDVCVDACFLLCTCLLALVCFYVTFQSNQAYRLDIFFLQMLRLDLETREHEKGILCLLFSSSSFLYKAHKNVELANEILSSN